jgi:hypothetical protein
LEESVMPRIATDDVLADTDKVMKVWKANPGMSIMGLTPADVDGARAGVAGLDASIEDLRHQLTALLDRRNDQAQALNELVVRVRGAIKSNFGADSPEYEQAGGTRTSERKKPTRKTT